MPKPLAHRWVHEYSRAEYVTDPDVECSKPGHECCGGCHLDGEEPLTDEDCLDAEDPDPEKLKNTEPKPFPNGPAIEEKKEVEVAAAPAAKTSEPVTGQPATKEVQVQSATPQS